MVKSINVAFEDKEIKKLEETKGNLSWHDFIIRLLDRFLEDSETKK